MPAGVAKAAQERAAEVASAVAADALAVAGLREQAASSDADAAPPTKEPRTPMARNMSRFNTILHFQLQQTEIKGRLSAVLAERQEGCGRDAAVMDRVPWAYSSHDIAWAPAHRCFSDFPRSV